MPIGFYDADGEVVRDLGIRPKGQRIPVAYLCRVYDLATGENLILLNRGVPVAERKACFRGQSSLELTGEEGRQLAKRSCLGDLSQQGRDGPMDVGVPDFPHPGVPDVSMQDPTDYYCDEGDRSRIPEGEVVDHSESQEALVFDNTELKEECARLFVETAAEHFSVDAAPKVGVPTSDPHGVEKATHMALELFRNVSPPNYTQVVTEVNLPGGSSHEPHQKKPRVISRTLWVLLQGALDRL